MARVGLSLFSAIRHHLIMTSRPSSDMARFREDLREAKDIVVISGAGISAESGIPTFRGAGGLWRTYQATDLATPRAFARDPGLVWEFYHYRRELMRTKKPNAGHYALAALEDRLSRQGRVVTIVTQNIDNLHFDAGSRNVIELHGNLFKTRCLQCEEVRENRDSPICEGLRGKGAPDANQKHSKIPVEDLPHCKKPNCSGLLRPHVVWFGESLDPEILNRSGEALDRCDLCLVVGTSAVVYPAAGFASTAAARGVPVAEFNLEATPVTYDFAYHFQGPSGELLPKALAPFEDEKK